MWHGSKTSNWYSIIRNGLRNLSNTSMMTSGPAGQGEGIYTGREFQTSCQYAIPDIHHNAAASGESKEKWHASEFKKNIIISAVEVIKNPAFEKRSEGLRPNFGGWGCAVIPDDNAILLRYLFVVTPNQYGS
jgi:hypothetical protein